MKSLNLSDKLKKLLVGCQITWEDTNPMSENMDEKLHFYFETNTNPVTDLLLKKNGLHDASQILNLKFRWLAHIQMIYETPNNKEKSHHMDHHYFEFFGTVFPISPKFRLERDGFYMMKNLEHEMVPTDNRNKGYYKKTIFSILAVGIT